MLFKYSGKYVNIYFNMKITFYGNEKICLKLILYMDYVQYYVTQVCNFDTCVYISENKCTSPLKTMYGTFFF